MENIDFNNIEFAIIIQCSIAKRRCSGFYCVQSFYDKKGAFSNYPKDKNIMYLSMECGGCCGKGVSSLLGHFNRKMVDFYKIPKDKTVVHLASCMTNDHHHYDRCPHLEYIKDIIVRKHGFKNIIEGSFIWSGSEELRESGKYNTY
ncbi:CGGC domain-containing protein [Cetobacterium somerae]|jgi:predicted metal-binding protein|nr:CGGC domain-containing protein [Cetobacterium sp. NK01]MCQ8213653.1 CGGC domain-containing protein [Cetobacterium sp. NK01]